MSAGDDAPVSTTAARASSSTASAVSCSGRNSVRIADLGLLDRGAVLAAGAPVDLDALAAGLHALGQDVDDLLVAQVAAELDLAVAGRPPSRCAT